MIQSEGEWLIPFCGRNASGMFTQNFLWRHRNVYVMDNHRAALWCWLQRIDPKQPYSLFHMDQHYDTLTSRMTTWLENLPADWSLGIEEYLSLTVKHRDIPQPLPLFRWDNYLSIFLAVFGQALEVARFATHDVGTAPSCAHINCRLWDVPSNLDFWLKESRAPWMFNLDLDYFFWHGDEDEPARRMVSERYISSIAKTIGAHLAGGTISVLTVALSPECCGGWEQSEQALEIALKPLGIEFRLPN
ncbi:conserved hypothetical protein [Bradyrhizobium sp. STM 3843]|uniref:UPF0489 family protein n=1 Tax=Bradyrhizobium sp. STM 3843 TaxID=551947 RepID=UPI000240AFA5|nr:UPF0489 family protein [Bradyrhizobium sp. STM 3843]CCE06335.1 conserved hypothetical protein [Bradyrhizobium sp. STM 3843]